MQKNNFLKRLKEYKKLIDIRIKECREEIVKQAMNPSSSCCLSGEISGHQYDKSRLYSLFPELEEEN